MELSQLTYEDACMELGLVPKPLTKDGMRLDTYYLNGKNDGSVKFITNNIIVIKNWQTGRSLVVDLERKASSAVSHEKIQAEIQRMNADYVVYQAQQRKKALTRSKVAQNFYKSCEKAKFLHPYLKVKGLKPFSGVRMCTSEHFEKVFGYVPKGSNGVLVDPLLVIPIRGWLSGALAIQTLQFIAPDGQKYFFYGGRKSGAFWLSKKLPEQRTAKPILVLGEGLATVMSVVQNTTHSCTGVMVCDCGNFMAVATELRRRFPLALMIILSDVGNGEKQAKEASQAVGAVLQKPSFSADEIELFKQKFNGKKPSDWNDFYLIQDLNIGD